ncbi:helix-turn-helix domain-containing protein [Flavobacterium sp. N502540]|uniref:helix-turn-helix domain-containing protein n=1 Tax=Flavobacterium sp. N502540 TaxID=2986838 RepID=UPI00222449FF|nr:helix-turn-helix transcriptional regulator [Flavobacterium sp. N502540]
MIGENVRKIRIIKGYSQQYVADLLEMSQAAYSDMERGKTKISFEKLQKISLALNLHMNYIVNFHENKLFSSNLITNKEEINELKTHFAKERELYKEQIDTLKAEISYLRSKLDIKNNS